MINLKVSSMDYTDYKSTTWACRSRMSELEKKKEISNKDTDNIMSNGEELPVFD